MNPFSSFSRPVSAVVEFLAGFERANPKRAQRALWGGRNINYGNSVSFSNSKYGHCFGVSLASFLADSNLLLLRTRRTWKPNVQTKRLYSEIFDASLKLRVTTHVKILISFSVRSFLLILFPSFCTFLSYDSCLARKVLRIIDKYGGLDNYLLKTPDAKLDSELGSRLKAHLAEQQRRILAGEPLLALPKEAQ